jgi:hypothetical protein
LLLADSDKRQVQIITGEKILLVGASGDTPVSVWNGLTVPVRVGVSASAPANSPLSVAKDASYVTVPAQKTVAVRMPVSPLTPARCSYIWSRRTGGRCPGCKWR